MNPTFQLVLDPLVDAAIHDAGRDTADALAASLPADDKQFLAAFRRAVRLEPNDADYYYMLGDALARLGRHQEAVPALREAIQMSPADGSYRLALGAALWRLGRYEEAAQALGEAVRLRAEDSASLAALGATLAALARHRDAVRVLHQAIRREGRHASAYNNLGAALWGMARRADALLAFRRACQLEPARTELQRNLARALSASGRADEAMACLREAIRRGGDDAELQLDLAELLYAAGRHADARAALDEALRLDPAGLRRRPAGQEIASALRLKELRAELSTETRAGAAAPALSALLAVLHALARALRALAPPRGGVGAVLWYLGLAAATRLAWCLVPPYFDYYVLKDRVAEVAGAPLTEDADVQERLRHAVGEQGLESLVREENCQIETRPKLRTIRCEYEQPIEIIPGLQRRLRFRFSVERPFLAPEQTIFF